MYVYALLSQGNLEPVIGLLIQMSVCSSSASPIATIAASVLHSSLRLSNYLCSVVVVNVPPLKPWVMTPKNYDYVYICNL